MIRTVVGAVLSLAMVLAGLAVGVPAAADELAATTLSKRVHHRLERFLQSRASSRVNHFEIPRLDSFDLAGIVPSEVDIELRTRLTGKLMGRVPVTVIVSRGSDELKRGVVTASLQSYVPVLVAIRSMRQGEVVTEEDVRRERRDITVVRGPVITRTANLLGMRLRRSINAGRIWQPRYLESVPKVLRGEIVRLRLVVGGLRIDGSGKASEDGRVGDWIRVLSNVSKRYVSGRVDGEGIVHVHF